VTLTLVTTLLRARITENIRGRNGYTYSPRTQLVIRPAASHWIQTADVSIEAAGAALVEIFKELDRVRVELVERQELEETRNAAAGLFMMRNTGRVGVIEELEILRQHALGIRFRGSMVSRMYAITAEDIRRVAQKYLTPTEMTVVVVGDKSKIDKQLSAVAFR
jgi:zinc protease